MIAGERVVARVRKNLFNAILGLEIAFFDATRTGELVNRSIPSLLCLIVLICRCSFASLAGWCSLV